MRGENKFKYQLETSSNKSLNFTIFSLIKKGKNPAQICKELNLKKTTLQYHLTTLKAQGLIKKIGYGTWEIDVIKQVQISTKDTMSQPELKEVRGHAFIWKVRVPKRVDWKAIFIAKSVDFKEIGLKGTPRIFIEGRKVWFGKKHVIIFEPESFFAINSIESRKLAVFKLLDLINKIEQKTGVLLSPYKFTPRREHFALVKNSLAIQCNKEGAKIYVKNDGGLWFLIDNSYNLNEAETIGQGALRDNLGVQRYFNEHKETNFQVTPKFILNGFAETNKSIEAVTQNQMIFAENMRSHIEAIRKLGDGVQELTKKVSELNKPKDL